MSIRGGHTLVNMVNNDFTFWNLTFLNVKFNSKQLLFYWSCPKNHFFLGKNGPFVLLNKLVKGI